MRSLGSSQRRTLIRHGNPQARLMPLNPLDHFEDHFGVAYVAFYRRTLDYEQLRRGLEVLLPSYPLLTGRMARSGRGQLAIALNDAGIPFDLRHSSDSFADWLYPDRDRIGVFVDKIVPQALFRGSKPLMTLRLTQLKGGGSVLGIGFGHVLADGTGFVELLQRWARAARGEPLAAGPCWDRQEMAAYLHDPAFDAATVPLAAEEYHGLCELSRRQLVRLYADVMRVLPHMTGLTLRLRGEAIEALKARVNAGHSEQLSSNDVISAYLYKLFNKCFDAPDDRPSRFLTVADLRSRTPGVPPQGLFAGMSGHLLHTATAREIAALDLHALGLQIRRMTRGIEARRFLEQEAWLGRRVERRRMHRVFAAHDPFQPGFFVSNCQRIPFYNMDFGSGRPACFTLPTELAPRIMQIWPVADGDGCELTLNVTRSMARQILPVLVRRGIGPGNVVGLALDAIA
jgi:shikimate O-hydroxycinnamoyltransferase